MSLHQNFARHSAFRHPEVTPYDGASPDSDAPQDSGIGVDYHIVLDDRVAGNPLYGVAILIEREALGTQRHTLIQFHIVAYDTRRTNYHTSAVVYREMMTDIGRRVNVDASLRVSHLGDDTGYELYAHSQQLVCHTVIDQSLDTGITTYNLIVRLRSRIPIICSLHVHVEHTLEFRQKINHLPGLLPTYLPAQLRIEHLLRDAEVIKLGIQHRPKRVDNIRNLIYHQSYKLHTQTYPREHTRA